LTIRTEQQVSTQDSIP